MTDSPPKPQRRRWRWLVATLLSVLVLRTTLLRNDFDAWEERLRRAGLLVVDPRTYNDPAIDGPLITLVESLSPRTYRVTISDDDEVTVLLAESASPPRRLQILVHAFVSDEYFGRLRERFAQAQIIDRRPPNP